MPCDVLRVGRYNCQFAEANSLSPGGKGTLQPVLAKGAILAWLCREEPCNQGLLVVA